MQVIGVAELKGRLSEYLGRAKEGEEVVVTEHGIPIVRLKRIPAREEPLILTRVGLLKEPELDLDDVLQRVRKTALGEGE